MFDRRIDAMRVADGELSPDRLDEAGRAEAARFSELSEAVRAVEAARASAAGLPDFEQVFGGVEARYEASRRQAAEAGREGWLAALIGRRPLWVLVPAGAAIMAVALGWVMLSGGAEAPPDNTCFVDSYDADKGSIFVDQDPDDPSQATVIWVMDEEEG